MNFFSSKTFFVISSPEQIPITNSSTVLKWWQKPFKGIISPNIDWNHRWNLPYERSFGGSLPAIPRGTYVKSMPIDQFCEEPDDIWRTVSWIYSNILKNFAVLGSVLGGSLEIITALHDMILDVLDMVDDEAEESSAPATLASSSTAPSSSTSPPSSSTSSSSAPRETTRQRESKAAHLRARHFT